MLDHFFVQSEFQPAGDQPAAVRSLAKGIQENVPFQTLLGVTGSGKTFTIAKVLEQLGGARPALVLSHNKTLAAQLYSEFKSFLPENSQEIPNDCTAFKITDICLARSYRCFPAIKEKLRFPLS